MLPFSHTAPGWGALPTFLLPLSMAGPLCIPTRFPLTLPAASLSVQPLPSHLYAAGVTHPNISWAGATLVECSRIAGPAQVAWSHTVAELGWTSCTSNSSWWIHGDGVAVDEERGDPKAALASLLQLSWHGPMLRQN